MSRRIVMTAAAAVFTSGCFDIPPYNPKTSVSYTEDKDGSTVTGPGFALRFAGGNSFHFPDQLLIDGADVLGHAEPMPACFGESEAGFVFSPTPRISADTAVSADGANNTLVPMMNQLGPVLRGPAVVQVKLAWASKFQCMDGNGVTPSGTSTFTVFPDGRIVRHDMLNNPNPPTPPAPTATNCNCDSTAGISLFTVSPHWTLARDHFHDLYAPDGPIQPPVSLVDEINSPDRGCLTSDNYQLAFAWHDSTKSTIHGAGNLIAFGFYHTLIDSVLDSLPWENSFAMFIERSNNNACVTALVRANEYTNPSPLLINKNSTMPSTLDGIYGGASDDQASIAQTGIMLMTDQVKLTGTVPSSFAVWLHFPHAVDVVRATLPGMTGPWYLPQQVDDHSWIVWFRDPLLMNQTITIESI